MDYTEIRHYLHRHPQTAGCEQAAHDAVVRHLQSLHPDRVYTHVGGWGVVALWGSDEQRPTVALRADTDALPIGHRCGHDGHTTILMRVAEMVDSARPPHNVLLLWQPAEETGEGARAVLESGVLQRHNIVRFYALHNLPGYPLGTVVVCPSTFAAASTGVVYTLEGRCTHASTPELGINPGLAVAEIIGRFDGFNRRTPAAFRQSTLICARVGEPAFGTSAGRAELMFTLRAFTNRDMELLLAEANRAVDDIALRHGLAVHRALREPFRATENDPACVRHIKEAAPVGQLVVRDEPFRWSEDFAEYLMHYRGAMFGIGSGERQPELHHPDYDFPDALVEPAARMLNALSCRPVSD